MKKINLQFTVLALLFATLFTSCEKSDSFPSSANDEINLFVWRGMNTFYLWQSDVPDLADTRFSNVGQLFANYSNFASPREVFESLRFQPGVVDRFSVIVDDYIALENSFQGINESTGMEFCLVRYQNDPSDVFGYVRYVVPGSDAETK